MAVQSGRHAAQHVGSARVCHCNFGSMSPVVLVGRRSIVLFQAQQAYSQLRQSQRSQSVLVSGESGAGKVRADVLAELRIHLIVFVDS